MGQCADCGPLLKGGRPQHLVHLAQLVYVTGTRKPGPSQHELCVVIGHSLAVRCDMTKCVFDIDSDKSIRGTHFKRRRINVGNIISQSSRIQYLCEIPGDTISSGSCVHSADSSAEEGGITLGLARWGHASRGGPAKTQPADQMSTEGPYSVLPYRSSGGLYQREHTCSSQGYRAHGRSYRVGPITYTGGSLWCKASRSAISASVDTILRCSYSSASKQQQRS